MQGVKVVANQMGVIQDIQYNEKERSSNIFSKLPFYETIACKNMYVSISITGDNSIWERLTVVGINFFLLGFVILMIARTASVISHWMGEKSFSVRTSVKVLIWVVCAPFIYIYSVALLDFYHSWWIIPVKTNITFDMAISFQSFFPRRKQIIRRKTMDDSVYFFLHYFLCSGENMQNG